MSLKNEVAGTAAILSKKERESTLVIGGGSSTYKKNWKVSPQKRSIFKKYAISSTWLSIQKPNFVFNFQLANVKYPKLSYPCKIDAESLITKLSRPSFTDSFSTLATIAFQTVENRKKGEYRYILSKKVLRLEKLSKKPLSRREREQNKRVIKVFKKFALQEYGIVHLKSTQFSYGFDLDKMEKNGDPLQPEHVYKINIGVNHITLSHLEELREKFISSDFDIYGRKKLSKVWDLKKIGKTSESFSVREIRGIIRCVRKWKKGTNKDFGKDLLEFIRKFWPNKLSKKNSKDKVSWLAEVLLSSTSDFNKIFTGKKICDKAITGRSHKNQSLNFQEVLQIFQQSKKMNFFSFAEILSHVLIKKQLLSQNLKTGKYHTGLLIPGMGGVYVVKSCFDNFGGNLSLEPLHSDYKFKKASLPYIKVFGEVGGSPFIDPWGTFSSMNFEDVKKFEFSELKKRMVPIWVYYLLYARKLEKSNKSFTRDVYDILLKSLKLYRKWEKTWEKRIRKVKEPSTSLLQPRVNFLLKRLMYIARDNQELPINKTKQDIAFVGEGKVGGTLAQKAMCIGPRFGYVPCPGFRFICQTFGTPMVDEKFTEEFMEFGRYHRKIIQKMGARWKSSFASGYGNSNFYFGKGGHLGASMYSDKKDMNWLKIKTCVFKMQKKSSSLESATLPVGQRRFGLDWNCRVRSLSPSDLNKLDSTQWLTPSQRKLTGMLHGKGFLEGGRVSLNFIFFPLSWLIRATLDQAAPPIANDQRENGILSINYKKMKFKY